MSLDDQRDHPAVPGLGLPAAVARPPTPASGTAVPSAAWTLWSGVPTLVGGEAILTSTERGGRAPIAPLPRLGGLAVHLTAGDALRVLGDAPDAALALYVGDLAVPAAWVRLADALDAADGHPLDVAWPPGATLRLALRARRWPIGAALWVTLRAPCVDGSPDAPAPCP